MMIGKTIALSSAALLLVPVFGLAQTTMAEQTKAVRAAVDLMQGTWILKLRTAPDGTPHAKPIEGVTIFNLEMDTKGPVPRAKGNLYSKERGVLDAVVSAEQMAAAESAPAADPSASKNQLFEMEATSQLDLKVSPDSTGTSALVTLAHSNLFVKGTYGVFRNGVHTPKIENKFRSSLVTTHSATKGTRTHSRLALVSETRQNVPAAALGPGSLSDRSHQFAALVVNGDRMDITWGNGAKDIWVRTSK